MASFIYVKRAWLGFVSSEYSWATGASSVKCALVKSTYDPTNVQQYIHTHLDWDTDGAPHEVSGTGYSSGGLAAPITFSPSLAELPTVDFNNNENMEIILPAVEWPSITLSGANAAKGAIFYQNDTTKAMIAFVDFGALVTPTAAKLAISQSRYSVRF